MTSLSEEVGVAAEPALVVENLSKTFYSQRVLSEVCLTIQPGEIRALAGANGSGKSTLVKILAGVYVPDDGGTITVAGDAVTVDHQGATTAALRFVHQDLGLVASLDAVDNVALGHGYRTLRGGVLHLREEAREVRRSLAELGYDIDVSRPVGELTACEQTSVAIARALSPRRAKARLLVLDEPTANLPAADVDRLFALVRRVQAAGVAVLFISHHLDEVFGLADSVTVLRDGRVVGTHPVKELDEAKVIHLMLGREVAALQQNPDPDPVERTTDPMLTVHEVSGKIISGLNIALHPGEIVGVAGISGSGREEVAGLLFGSLERTGEVSLSGKQIPGGRPEQAIIAGLGLVPADRRTNAAFMEATLRENLCMIDHRPHVSQGLLRLGRERATTRTWLDRLGVRPRNTEARMGELSGGNQQRVVLARWLRTSPRVLILDEPTQGVDVGAKAEIHRFLREAAEDGMAILVVSTDNDELAHLCQRVVILRDGRVADELRAPHIDVDRLVVGTVGSHQTKPEPANGSV
jgi:ribose transport system ATP-binding protein